MEVTESDCWRTVGDSEVIPLEASPHKSKTAGDFVAANPERTIESNSFISQLLTLPLRVGLLGPTFGTNHCFKGRKGRRIHEKPT
jgi:hypothetical protein